MQHTLSAVVLAGGAGKRMRSSTPKPLTQLAGRPLLAYVMEAIAAQQPDRIVVVVGQRAAEVMRSAEATMAELAERSEGLASAGAGSTELTAKRPPELLFALQPEARGTGDALAVALKELPATATSQATLSQVIVAPADAPLVRASTFQALLAAHSGRADEKERPAATVLTAQLPDATGYGRIVRSALGGSEITEIVEHRDATADQLLIQEINSSIYCFEEAPLRQALAVVMNTPADNAQNEILLTTTVEVLRSQGHRVTAQLTADASEVMGVNDIDQLAACEIELQRRCGDR